MIRKRLFRLGDEPAQSGRFQDQTGRSFCLESCTLSSSTNGVVTYCDYKDYGAILFGGLAVLAAVIGAAMNRQRDNLLFAGAAALTGLYSLAAGLGLIGAPCG